MQGSELFDYHSGLPLLHLKLQKKKVLDPNVELKNPFYVEKNYYPAKGKEDFQDLVLGDLRSKACGRKLSVTGKTVSKVIWISTCNGFLCKKGHLQMASRG